MLRRNKSWAIALLVLVFVSGSAFSVWAQGISPSGGGGAPSGPAGGDLSGTYPNPTVAGVNGTPIPGAGNLIGGDGGSVSPGTGLTISGGTLSGTIVADDCTSGTCSGQAAGVIPAADAGKTVLLGAHAYTLAQAGTAGFTTGFGFCVVNKSTTGNATITATVSVFHAGGETTVLTLEAGSSTCISTDSDNANYLAGISHFLGTAAAISPTALAGDVNDYNPTNLSKAQVLLIDGGAADRNITGIAGGFDARLLCVVNAGATNNLVMKANSGSSAAANRFDISADITIKTKGGRCLRYDQADAAGVGAWRPNGAQLENTGVSAGSCGDATHSCSITVGVDGRLTAQSNNVISASGGTPQLMYGSSVTQAQNLTKFYSPVGTSLGAGSDAGVGASVIDPAASTTWQFTQCRSTNNAGAVGQTFTFTLFVNSSSTSATCTISGGTNTGTVSGTATVTTGQPVSVQLVTSATSNATGVADWNITRQ